MGTVVSIMDRDGWAARTDNIVVVDPSAERLVWVPRDLWCPRMQGRICAAFRSGGHAALIAALAEHEIAVEHGICLRRAATERALEGVTVEVPVGERMTFEYPEEGGARISFEPPAEKLTGDRLHQWLGARYRADGNSSDLTRIERQQTFVLALLAQGFSFEALLADPERVDVSDPAAIDEVRRVRPTWKLETLGPLTGAIVEGSRVLVRGSGEEEARGATALRMERAPTHNFSRGREGMRPLAVVIHTTDGTASGAVSWFANPESGVSAHYLVALDGRVTRFVEEADTAYHAGRVRDPTAGVVEEGPNPNLYTVGIEFEDGGDPEGCRRPVAQYRAGARLLAEVTERWSIPLDREHVIGHRELFSAKTCPGNLDLEGLIDKARTARRPLACLLPVRDGAADVPGYLECVGHFADWVIALDDGSTDETYELLGKSTMVRRLRNAPRPGSGWDDAANRTRLLEAAVELKAGWALFLDVDERIDPEDGAALRDFLATDALPGCAYGLELHRMWRDLAVPGFTWVYRLFAPRSGQVLPARRLHFEPVPTHIPRRAWIRTTIRIRHLDGPNRLKRRFEKYARADPLRAYERRPARLLEEPAEPPIPWEPRPEDVPVLDPGRVAARLQMADEPTEARRRAPPAAETNLTCLLPVRNGERDLPGYLESASRFADSVIALDDGSTDATRELLEGASLVRGLLSNPRREGSDGWDDGANRDRLLQAAIESGSDWVLFLDVDERIDADDAHALASFLRRGAEPGNAYGFRIFRMVGEPDRYDRAELWVYRLFAPERGQVLPDQRLHLVPVPTSIPSSRWHRTTIRIQHLASLTEERRQERVRKYEQADPSRRYQRSYSDLLAVDGPLKRWRRRPPGLPVLADPLGRGKLAELDLERVDLEAPLLSAIVIARDDQDRIERAVRSVVDQECPHPFEVIVVVSGTDRTAEIVRERFPGVRLIELAGKALPGRARNAGVEAARGEYVSFPGSHVELPPGSLAARMEAHERGYAMVTGSMLNGTESRSGWASYFLDHSRSLPGRPSGELPGPPDICSYAREFLLEAGGFPEDLRAGEDTAVNRVLFARGHRAYRSEEILLVHRSRCSNPWRLIRHHFQRGRGWGRIVLDDHRGSARLLRRRFVGFLLIRYVPVRVSRTSRHVADWAGELRPRYRRVLPLVIVATLAAWVGVWVEILRPGRAKLGILLADQSSDD